jgi:predicted ATP-dependent protease
VLIPAANVKHLMLKHQVVEAVSSGKFHIYPVAGIDEGIEILTGVPSGQRDALGQFPEGSINGRVERRLAEFADRMRSFRGAPPPGKRKPARRFKG